MDSFVETSRRQFVEELASLKLTGFRRMIDEDGQYYDDVYRSNASLTENIATDYRGRFLIELIQNAYDAHAPGTKDGQIDRFWLIEVLQVKYLNNIIEQGHRFIKKLTKQMKGFKSFNSAAATLEGIEVGHTFQKNQFEQNGVSPFKQFAALAG